MYHKLYSYTGETERERVNEEKERNEPIMMSIEWEKMYQSEESEHKTIQERERERE